VAYKTLTLKTIWTKLIPLTFLKIFSIKRNVSLLLTSNQPLLKNKQVQQLLVTRTFTKYYFERKLF
jgi:hypothetical protein